jgi:hypothetical protein
MLCLSLWLLLNNKGNFINGSKKLLNLKSTKGVTCPAVNPDTASCTDAYAGVATAIGLWTAEEASLKTAFETAVNLYLTECKGSQCQTACQALLPTTGVEVAQDGAGAFGTSFASCNPPQEVTTKTKTCTTPTADGSTCTTLYNEIKALAVTTGWSGSALKPKVESFIDSCSTTTCRTACRPVIVEVNLASPFTSFLSAFTVSCNPQTSGNDGDGGDDGDGDGGDGDKKNDAGLMIFKSNIILIFTLLVTIFLQFIISW